MKKDIESVSFSPLDSIFDVVEDVDSNFLRHFFHDVGGTINLNCAMVSIFPVSNFLSYSIFIKDSFIHYRINEVFHIFKVKIFVFDLNLLFW